MAVTVSSGEPGNGDRRYAASSAGVTEHSREPTCLVHGVELLGQHVAPELVDPFEEPVLDLDEPAAERARCAASSLAGLPRQRARRPAPRSSWKRAAVIGPASAARRLPSKAANSAPNSGLSASPHSSSTMNSARMRSTSAAASMAVGARELGQERAGDRGAELAVVGRPVLGRLPHGADRRRHGPRPARCRWSARRPGRRRADPARCGH